LGRAARIAGPVAPRGLPVPVVSKSLASPIRLFCIFLANQFDSETFYVVDSGLMVD
jgi:hypothetical protein